MKRSKQKIKVWHSLDLLNFQDNWELWKKTRLNHDDVSDLQVVALKRGQCSRFRIPSWMTVQKVFSQSELAFSQVPSCLELTAVRFPSSEFTVVLNTAQIMLHWQHGQGWMFILLSLDKRPLYADLGHTSSPLNSRQVISLQCLQLATDSFHTTHCWICDFQHKLMFMSNGRWAPIHFIYNLSSYDKDWKGFASRLPIWFMMMTACLFC